MSTSRIAFDGFSSDDSSCADTTSASLLQRLERRYKSATPKTPTRKQGLLQTPRSSRTRRSALSPIPGPSGRSPAGTPVRKGKVSAITAPNLDLDPSRRRRKSVAPKRNKRGLAREIYNLQCSTKLLIPRAPFGRLVREILQEFGGHELRVQSLALEAMQEATELFVTQFFEDAYRCTMHRNQITLKPSDFVLVRTLRRNYNDAV